MANECNASDEILTINGNKNTIAEFSERAIDATNILDISFCSQESLEFVEMPAVEDICLPTCTGIKSNIFIYRHMKGVFELLLFDTKNTNKL